MSIYSKFIDNILLLRYNKMVICVQNFLHYIDKK